MTYSVSDDISDFICEDFDIPFKKRLGPNKNWFFGSWLMTTLKAKPVVDGDMCIGCEICRKNCPPEVITMKDTVQLKLKGTNSITTFFITCVDEVKCMKQIGGLSLLINLTQRKKSVLPNFNDYVKENESVI